MYPDIREQIENGTIEAADTYNKKFVVMADHLYTALYMMNRYTRALQRAFHTPIVARKTNFPKGTYFLRFG